MHCGPYSYDFIDDHHQKSAFTTDYFPDSGEKPDTQFRHWLFEKYRNTVLDSVTFKEHFVRTNSTGSSPQESEIGLKSTESYKFDWGADQTYIVIGDSLGKQIQGGFLKMSYFGVKHGHLRAFLGQNK